jgi:hypothetical protein
MEITDKIAEIANSNLAFLHNFRAKYRLWLRTRSSNLENSCRESSGSTLKPATAFEEVW